MPRVVAAINNHAGRHVRKKKKKNSAPLPAMPIAVNLVTDATMKKMNTLYRRKATTTDVLSFAYVESGTPVFPGELAGEIVISYQQARRQAKQVGLKIRDELAILTVHGALHILGYDHEKSDAGYRRMLRAENRILADIGLESGLIGR